MSEKFNLVIFFDDLGKLPPKKYMIDLLFSLASRWFKSPTNYMLLDLVNGKEENNPWGEYVEKRLGESFQLFIYDINPVNCIVVNEGDFSISYTISVDFKTLKNIPLIHINNWLVSLFNQLSVFSVPLMAGGSEFELQKYIDEVTSLDFLEFALSSFADCDWILIPVHLLQQEVSIFNILKYDNIILLYNERNRFSSSRPT